jgi:AcrR family transcriptional regulator
LVHYYFGSIEELLMQVLERFTERILTRQRAMYEDPNVPFIEKWRKAMNYIDVDLDAGYPKIWYELQAMAWNKPEFRARLQHLYQQWDEVLTDAVATAMREYGLDRRKYPAHAISTLVRTFNEGLLLERLSGHDDGHRELLKMIDSMLQRWERKGS